MDNVNKGILQFHEYVKANSIMFGKEYMKFIFNCLKL